MLTLFPITFRLVDVLNDRRMEVETILGNPVKVAKGLGIEVPRMEMLYALTKGLDEGVTFKQPGQSLGGDETRLARSKKEGKSTL
jgi:2-dehydropantoate 2-reductase